MEGEHLSVQANQAIENLKSPVVQAGFAWVSTPSRWRDDGFSRRRGPRHFRSGGPRQFKKPLFRKLYVPPGF